MVPVNAQGKKCEAAGNAAVLLQQEFSSIFWYHKIRERELE